MARFCEDLKIELAPCLLCRFVDKRDELREVNAFSALFCWPETAVEIPVIRTFREFFSAFSFEVFSDRVLDQFDDPCRFVGRVS